MSRLSINRKKARLKSLFGIRARLVLLALILVGPMMFERVRSLEAARVRQIASVTSELTGLAQRTADSQREVISSVEAVLRATAFIHKTAAQTGQSCAAFQASVRVDLPSIRSLHIAGADGVIRCSTEAVFIGLDLGDRSYFRKAIESGDFVVSDFVTGRQTNKGTILAAFPVNADMGGVDAVIVAGINLDWLSGVMNNLADLPGVTAALIDADGIILATPRDQLSMIGHSIDKLTLSAAPAHSGDAAEVSPGWTGRDRVVSFTPIRGSQARLVVAIDTARVSAGINHEIRTAYLQLALVCLCVLLGALVGAERLIVQPIGILTAMAQRFGQGDWSARAIPRGLPAEFAPLARAFNSMAAKLSERERELIAANNRLTVMASIDPLSGLANRRGFQSRLDFEWLKAVQTDASIALLMIDVDHFKLFNDTYGHPEGDRCLSLIGETLASIAIETCGFAARYGGEEFCLLLPNTDAEKSMAAGELVRGSIEDLGLPHRTSGFRQVTVSVGVACAAPTESLSPRDLIEGADAALYTAKFLGRNAVAGPGDVRAPGSPLALAG